MKSEEMKAAEVRYNEIESLLSKETDENKIAKLISERDELYFKFL